MMSKRPNNNVSVVDGVEDTLSTFSAISKSNKGDNDLEQDGIEDKSESTISRHRTTVTLCILMTEMFERLAFYSVSANMVLYCTSKLGFSTVDATTTSLVFSALANLFPVLGGYVADSWTGRFRTIVFSVLLNLLAMVLIQTSSVEFNTWFEVDLNQVRKQRPSRLVLYVRVDICLRKAKRSFYLVGLLLLTLGTGGIKANISPFGAEQLESLGKEAVQSFFNWFYWVINAGALLAYSGVAYLQQNESFAWGLFVPLVATVTELLVFLAPCRLYVKTRPNGSKLSHCFRSKLSHCSRSKLSHCSRSELSHCSRSKLFGGDTSDVIVDGLAGVIAVLPFCFLVIVYYTIYSQTTSSFFVQSERMDVGLGPVNIPAAMLNTVGNISIIILIPVIDRFFYPCMKKVGLPLTHLKRIGIGMILALLAVVVAGIVEIYRKDVMHQPGGSHVQVLANENFTASSLSVFAQVPQFALIGASEIFTSVTCLEFAYTQAPVSLQGLLTGLFLAAWGFGNLLSMGILLVVEEATRADPWYGDEINNLKMENFMFLLAGLMAVNFLVFCGAAHVYRTIPTGTDDGSLDQALKHGSGRETSSDDDGQLFHASTETIVTGCSSAVAGSRENVVPSQCAPVDSSRENTLSSQCAPVDSSRENTVPSQCAAVDSSRENGIVCKTMTTENGMDCYQNTASDLTNENTHQLIFVRL
ncbi:unnamed protein product [Lymnaea stagnalis]|uniref:Uncharacterized protein n=1 Tax=Lymnaea stagnalis TaxID=6523 RepID=A0AAV2IHC7_LYMST